MLRLLQGWGRMGIFVIPRLSQGFDPLVLDKDAALLFYSSWCYKADNTLYGTHRDPNSPEHMIIKYMSAISGEKLID